MPNIPAMSKEESPSLYKIEYEDVGMRGEVDGGYTFSRPRHTRSPRRTISTGWIDVPHTDKDAIISWFESMGTFDAFNYTHYMESDELVNVRLEAPPKITYEGMGTNKRWTIKLVMGEV